MTLVEFLTARLDERQAIAQAAMEVDSASWTVRTDVDGERPCVMGSTDSSYVILYEAGSPELPTAHHIAYHDPAWVLADIDATRRALRYATACRGAFDEDDNAFAAGASYAADYILQMLALPYADHPDYRQEWTP